MWCITARGVCGCCRPAPECFYPNSAMRRIISIGKFLGTVCLQPIPSPDSRAPTAIPTFATQKCRWCPSALVAALWCLPGRSHSHAILIGLSFLTLRCQQQLVVQQLIATVTAAVCLRPGCNDVSHRQHPLGEDRQTSETLREERTFWEDPICPLVAFFQIQISYWIILHSIFFLAVCGSIWKKERKCTSQIPRLPGWMDCGTEMEFSSDPEDVSTLKLQAPSWFSVQKYIEQCFNKETSSPSTRPLPNWNWRVFKTIP